MKKSVLALTLAGVLTVGGSIFAFADEVEDTRGFRQNGTSGVENLMEEGLSFEEAKSQRLIEKFERVDSAVQRGVITAEEAAEIKMEMESNSKACSTPGENQGTHEGYGLNQGLGRNDEGCGNGLGSGNGYGKSQGGGRGAGMSLRDGSCAGN